MLPNDRRGGTATRHRLASRSPLRVRRRTRRFGAAGAHFALRGGSQPAAERRQPLSRAHHHRPVSHRDIPWRTAVSARLRRNRRRARTPTSPLLAAVPHGIAGRTGPVALEHGAVLYGTPTRSPAGYRACSTAAFRISTSAPTMGAPVRRCWWTASSPLRQPIRSARY